MPEDPITEAFFDEVRVHGQVFGLADDKGFAAPETTAGQRAMPFWSRRSRVERVRATVPAYRPLQVVALPVEAWRDRWLAGLAADGLRVGLNWAGPAATGIDLAPEEVAARLAEGGPEGGVTAGGERQPEEREPEERQPE